MNYKEQIFRMLNLEPHEEFRLSSPDSPESLSYSYTYRLNNNLTLQYKASNVWNDSTRFTITNILDGSVVIRKKIKPTREEQLAIDYAKACGMNYISQDSDGEYYAYNERPSKQFQSWYCVDKAIEIGIPISFISWNDEEPYYIGE